MTGTKQPGRSDADGLRPRVEVARLRDGERTWKINAIAEDTSLEALREAAVVALRLEEELSDPESELYRRARQATGVPGKAGATLSTE